MLQVFMPLSMKHDHYQHNFCFRYLVIAILNCCHEPFLITGYQGPDYFCDREKETASLMSALKNGKNITLISPRRMGKTGL